MEDVFYRAIDLSDPVISDISLSVRREKTKKLPIPHDAIHDAILLLEPPPDPTYIPPRQLFGEDEEEGEMELHLMDNVVLLGEEVPDPLQHVAEDAVLGTVD